MLVFIIAEIQRAIKISGAQLKLSITGNLAIILYMCETFSYYTIYNLIK